MSNRIGKNFRVLCLSSCLIIFAGSGSAQTIYKTPQAAAKALYAAWRVKSKSKAKAAADSKAISRLFSTNFISRRRFAGCTDDSETEKGLFVCVYSDPTDDLLNVAFEAVKRGKSWRVRQVTFAAEN